MLQKLHVNSSYPTLCALCVLHKDIWILKCHSAFLKIQLFYRWSYFKSRKMHFIIVVCQGCLSFFFLPLLVSMIAFISTLFEEKASTRPGIQFQCHKWTKRLLFPIEKKKSISFFFFFFLLYILRCSACQLIFVVHMSFLKMSVIRSHFPAL